MSNPGFPDGHELSHPDPSSAPGDQYGAGSGAKPISLAIFPKRFLARIKQVLWRFAGGINGQMPLRLRERGGQTEIARIGACIEHQVKCALIVFMDQTRKLFFTRVSPVGQSPMRAKPVDLGIRVELLLTQNRMGPTKGDHATSESKNFPVLFEAAPVIPTRFVVLAVGVIIAALRATKFVAAEQHRHAARDQQCEKEVLYLAFPRGLDPGIIRLAFRAEVLAEVGVGSVMVVLYVFFIVLSAIN